jgi:glycosyltransferase involved in cell wall biosynthesis
MAENPNAQRCLVILPTYNERDNVARLLGKLLRASESIDVLVVDDSSPDGTAAAVRELQRSTSRVRLIERPKKMGLGSAYLLGFEMAVHEGFGAACTMDADHSHDPVHLAEMLPLVADYDLIIGSRYVAGGTVEGFNVLRKVNSIAANILARRIVGKDIRDCTSGYRIYSTALLQQLELLALKASGYSMLIELLYEARVCRARVVEYPITYKNRIAGKSKISYLEVLGSLRTLFRLKIRQLKARSALSREVLEPSEATLPLR